jgi:hypothetical protein
MSTRVQSKKRRCETTDHPSERERQLENTISDLTRRLHEEPIRTLLDLRVAGGLVNENERSESEPKVTKLGDDALELMRQDLVKVLARISNPTSIHDTAGRSTTAPYIH